MILSFNFGYILALLKFFVNKWFTIFTNLQLYEPQLEEGKSKTTQQKLQLKKNFIKANIANKIYVANLNTSKQQHHQAGEK